MSRDTQTGVNPGFPFLSSTLNAATPPFSTAPYENCGLNLEAAGPQKGTNTHTVPSASSQLARLPQTPAAAKFTSSLQTRGVRSRGVRWSAPPSDFESRRKTRHSLLDVAS